MSFHNKWYDGKCREEWSLGRKAKYYVIRTVLGCFTGPVLFILLLLVLGAGMGLTIGHYEKESRKNHLLPYAEAEQWASQAGVRAENIFCTGTEEYVGNDHDAQCVITTADKKLITLACANVWVQRTGCKIEHLEK